MSRRAALGVLSAALAAPLLAACGDGGFRPLYGPSASGAPLGERMAQVHIATVPGRVGQRIRNELIFVHTGGAGKTDDPQFSLEIVIKESVASTLVSTTGESLSQVYGIDASFRLIRRRDKAVVLQGTTAARAGFARFDAIFANVRAREDAENRAAKQVADELKTRLAIYLSANA